MARGGKRPGAGRPKGSGKYGEETKAVRLPVSYVDKILDSLNQTQIFPHPTSLLPLSLPKGDNIFTPDFSTERGLPLFMNPVAAGLPSPVEDYMEGKLDLNQHLIKHPAATFFVRVTGDSMLNAGIHPGDLLIVDRAIEPMNNKVVIAVVNSELTVKRIRKTRNKLLLMPENPNYEPIQIYAETDFQIWGVVTNVIHAL